MQQMKLLQPSIPQPGNYERGASAAPALNKVPNRLVWIFHQNAGEMLLTKKN